MIEFTPFPKIGRLKRNIVVTEKLDGTNAAVRIVPALAARSDDPYTVLVGDVAILAQSRNKFITPGKATDNYGFAGWVKENAEDLLGLGEGIHYGEWWGRGVQRGYGMAERRFSLFNTGRWDNDADECVFRRPACCSVVPVLYAGPNDDAAINGAMTLLGSGGSVAAPGFPNPEGIIVFHSATGTLFKRTFEHDEAGKEAA